MAAMPPLSLAELLDAAIGTPEVGAVNFTALHSLLRALLQHLGLHHLPAPTPQPAPTPHRAPGPPGGQPPQPAPGTPGGSVAPDVGQERSEARDGDSTEAPSVPRDLLEAISGVKAAQSRMAEDIRGIKELLGLVSCPRDGDRALVSLAGEQRGPRSGASPESDGEAAGSRSAASESSESPESGEEGTEHGGTPRGTQPAPRTGKGTPGTRPRSPGTRAGTRRAPATPERRAGAAPDRTGTAGAGATAPGTQPGVPGTQAAVLGTQPGSPGTQTSTPGAQPGSPGTQITTLGAQPGSPGTHVTGLESPGTHGTTPGTQPGSPGAPATTLGTQPGSPSTLATTTGMRTGSPSAPTTTAGTQPAPPWSRGGGGGGGGVQPSPPSTAPGLPGTEATPGARGTRADAARPEAQLHPAAQPLSPTAQGPQMSPDTAAGSKCPVPGSSAAGLAEALQRVAELGRLCATLQGQVARLEATKSDRAELEELRLLFPEGDQESIATLLADLRGRASSLQGLASDLHGQGEKIKQLQDALGELGLAGAEGKSGGSLGALLQELRTELREQQDAAKATLEQLVATTAGNLQEQLDELRSLLGGAGPDTFPASSPGGTEPVPAECPVCSTDVRAQLGQLLRRYEQLQELVDSVLARQAMGKATRHLPGRRWEDEELLKSIQASILQVQGDCEKLGSVTGNLVDDHHQKQKDIEALFQSLERLQKEKADKEELVLEIEVKADRAALAGKVSCAQFDAAVEQLNKTIEDTLSKVTGQEQGWHRIQQKLVEELGSKLDRLELAPLRQQLEERCRSILRQLEERAPQAEADDAAGIRKQLLAHFHCVSCDRPLRMAVPGPHIVTIPPMPPLPSRLSACPHAVFEPEHLRQHGRGECGAGCGYLRVPRRCGGQHTRTPPLQRCPRLQHLPPCAPGHLQPHAGLPVKDEVELLGQDGHIYKGRRDARLPALVGKDGSRGDKPQLSPGQRGTQDLLPSRPHSAMSLLSRPGTPRPQELRTASPYGRIPQGPGLPSPPWAPQDGRETPAAERGRGGPAESPPWAPRGGAGQEQ
ncbi:glutamine-rich protein 2 [Cygnus olor]|uniref:glutamine-rich protein 2 n=1 Tax=Cygnus olor TaxID=8869 RepID=UPI001ADE51CD|nr:glutamine-rich protein 2 [Cygnus olor]